MWTATDPAPAKPGNPKAGFTFVETLVVLVVFSVLVLATAKAMIVTDGANREMRRENRVNVRAQHVLNGILGDVATAVRLYGDDSEGDAALELLQGVSSARIRSSRLPRILKEGAIERDTTGVRGHRQHAALSQDRGAPHPQGRGRRERRHPDRRLPVSLLLPPPACDDPPGSGPGSAGAARWPGPGDLSQRAPARPQPGGRRGGSRGASPRAGSRGRGPGLPVRVQHRATRGRRAPDVQRVRRDPGRISSRSLRGGSVFRSTPSALEPERSDLRGHQRRLSPARPGGPLRPEEQRTGRLPSRIRSPGGGGSPAPARCSST